MNIEDIITLEDNKEYLILDVIKFNEVEYLYCVEMNENEMPTQNYKYFKGIVENEEYYIEEIVDENILKNIKEMFIKNNNDEQDV